MMRSVIYSPNEHGRAVHPTQKPEAVVEPLLLYSVPRGGLVLDPFGVGYYGCGGAEAWSPISRVN